MDTGSLLLDASKYPPDSSFHKKNPVIPNTLKIRKKIIQGLSCNKHIILNLYGVLLFVFLYFVFLGFFSPVRSIAKVLFNLSLFQHNKEYLISDLPSILS